MRPEVRKRAIRGTVGFLIAFVACSGGRPPANTAAGGSVHVRVLATHDFHGALRPATYAWSEGRPVGGAVAMKAVMARLEADCACPTVRLDGGDQMQGTLDSNLTMGASAVAAFNAIGLDAAAVGNHELDWGVETLLTRQREATYPWLAANVFLANGGTRPEWARPFAIVERDGAKVGVVGYTTVSTPRTQRPEATKPYQFRSGYSAIRDALDAVWRERPDFVVIVAHAGGGCSPSGCTGEMVDLALQLPPGRVHLIVGGHDHSAGEGVVNSIPIIRAGSSGRGVGVVDLRRDGAGIHTFSMTQQTIYADDVPQDAALLDLLSPAFIAADAKGKEVITTLDAPLFASSGDRRLGSLIAEAVRVAAKADVGLHNPGGVRADLSRGPVTYAHLHRVLPFDNAVVRLTLSGKQLRQLVSQTRSYYYSNLNVESDERSYTLATNDYLADGGDGLAMLAPLPRDAVGVSLLDATIAYLRVGSPVGQSSAEIIRGFGNGLAGVRAATADVRLSVGRDPAIPGEPVLLVEYPTRTADPAGRDVQCDVAINDWTAGRAIAFQVKPDRAVRMSLSFIDRNGVVYTAWRNLEAGTWQQVRIPFDEIQPNPYFQPPAARKGAPLDVSDVKFIAFAPQDEPAGRLAIGAFTLSQ